MFSVKLANFYLSTIFRFEKPRGATLIMSKQETASPLAAAARTQQAVKISNFIIARLSLDAMVSPRNPISPPAGESTDIARTIDMWWKRYRQAFPIAFLGDLKHHHQCRFLR